MTQSRGPSVKTQWDTYPWSKRSNVGKHLSKVVRDRLIFLISRNSTEYLVNIIIV